MKILCLSTGSLLNVRLLIAHVFIVSSYVYDMIVICLFYIYISWNEYYFHKYITL